MIVQQFLRWVRTAPPGDRADATSALARAYLHSPLEPDDKAAAEAAMTVLLDDPSPLVREALAQALAAEPDAPHTIIHALAHDRGDIAALVLEQSPVLTDAEMVDAVAAGDWRAQCAVARRESVSAMLAGAIAEVGSLQSCAVLVANPGARLTPGVMMRLIDRHGREPEVRNGLLTRPDLPVGVRQAAVSALAGSLCSLVAERGWLGTDRAERVGAEARDKATVAIAGTTRDADMRGFVRHLRQTGQLTPMLVLRALLSGNVRLFEEALSDLSGVPAERVSGFVHARRSAGFEPLYRRAGLPARAFPAFRAALDALQDSEFGESIAADARLSRRMTERVLTTVGALPAEDVGQLMLMLRRFAAEAARDAARTLADDLVKDILIAA